MGLEAYIYIPVLPDPVTPKLTPPLPDATNSISIQVSYQITDKVSLIKSGANNSLIEHLYFHTFAYRPEHLNRSVNVIFGHTYGKLGFYGQEK